MQAFIARRRSPPPVRLLDENGAGAAVALGAALLGAGQALGGPRRYWRTVVVGGSPSTVRSSPLRMKRIGAISCPGRWNSRRARGGAARVVPVLRDAEADHDVVEELRLVERRPLRVEIGAAEEGDLVGPVAEGRALQQRRVAAPVVVGAPFAHKLAPLALQPVEDEFQPARRHPARGIQNMRRQPAGTGLRVSHGRRVRSVFGHSVGQSAPVFAVPSSTKVGEVPSPGAWQRGRKARIETGQTRPAEARPMTTSYPRDMRGYGRNAPDPQWPNPKGSEQPRSASSSW